VSGVLDSTHGHIDITPIYYIYYLYHIITTNHHPSACRVNPSPTCSPLPLLPTEFEGVVVLVVEARLPLVVAAQDVVEVVVDLKRTILLFHP
jgi:hypothetical protein